jgi:hypothetical protein
MDYFIRNGAEVEKNRRLLWKKDFLLPVAWVWNIVIGDE